MQHDLQIIFREVVVGVRDLTTEQTQAMPLKDSGKWSIQQIVEHLILSYQSTFPAIERRLDKGTVTLSSPTLRQRVFQFLILDVRFFPHGLNAPATVRPGPVTPCSGDEIIENLGAVLQKTDDLIAAAEVLFGSSRAISHTSLGPMSMSQWRRFHLVHARHHLKQIARLRRERRF